VRTGGVREEDFVTWLEVAYVLADYRI
jgi:hypothetical protein